MPRRILVATDLSASADEAILSAHARATDSDPFAVCFVVPNLQPITPLFPQVTEQTIVDVAAMSVRAEEAVRERVSRLTSRPADGFEVFIDQGTGYGEIVRRAERWKADLLVVGSHGRTGLARLVLGDVAERVARYAPCAVLVARAGSHRGPVIAATDLSDGALHALSAARDVAAREKTELVVVHAVDIEPSLASMAGLPFGGVPLTVSAEVLEEVRSAAETTLATALKRMNAVAETRVVFGEASSAIVHEAKARDARLVVVATHGRTGLAQIALGSVAEKVARAAPCSVQIERHG
ncbi:MAG TPA: universal stress protein [Polyangiaceae bacterium]|jgi:nucleotide-binding universal stress UspA family protein|nr:universal stress protein [Polyangiaceae bacterium]